MMFEKVMMMVEKGEREWEGREHDDYWCCVMWLKGWRKIQGSFCHRKRESNWGEKLSGI